MNTVYEKMEACARAARATDGRSLARLLARLHDADWRVRFAATVALGDRADPQAGEALVGLLEAEDGEPLYSQRGDPWGIAAGSPDGTAGLPVGIAPREQGAWARRGRLKQAACLALGACGHATPAVLERLHRYATDQGEDYAVRAAANKALGLLRCPESRPVLERSAQDPEWCTATEARKALAARAPC